jgi:8-oxo-dGTP diphosphatase
MLADLDHAASLDHAIAAGVILRRPTPNGDRWLLLRATKHREWGFPKGHLDPGETLFHAALRECVEECGIALFAIEADPYELNYRLPSGRPKRVVYFPAVTASDMVVLSHEHDAFRWSTADEVRDRLHHSTQVTMFNAYLRNLMVH